MESRVRTSALARVAVCLALIGVLVFPIWTILVEYDHLPSGTFVGTLDVSGMSKSEAHRAVMDDIARIQSQPVSVDLGGTTYTVSPSELGLTYDASRALDALSHEEGRFGFASGHRHPIDVSLDGTALFAFLDRADAAMPQKATNARVELRDGSFTVIPGANGERIDRFAFSQDVISQADTFEPISVTANVVSGEPEISDADAASTAELANYAISNTWTLDANGTRIAIEGSSLVPAIVFAPTFDGTLGVAFDADVLNPVLDRALQDITSKSTKDAEVREVAGVSYLFPSTSGVTVDRTELLVKMDLALAGNRKDVVVPVSTSEPTVTTESIMADMGITEKIASGDSVFKGSGDGRAHNVKIAAKSIDGTLVAPGGTFSFNAAVGDLFDGRFQNAGSYIDGPDGMSMAGGVCQVSTTVYRAALKAGFPIVEWYPHTYRSGFYELGGWSPGYDAAIVQDSIVPAESTDLKFSNPTDAWLLIRASTDDSGVLSVEIRSAPTGWTVSFEDPVVEMIERAPEAPIEIVDEALPRGTVDTSPPMDGLRVTVVRHVRDKNGNVVSDDTIVSSYGAYGGIRRVSPDMAGKN